MRDKRALRAEMRAVRRTIAADRVVRVARSARIWASVVAATSLAPPARVLLFEGLPTEPETAGWFAWCRDHDVDVYRPTVDGPDLLVVAADGSGDQLDPLLLDLVVVPGLAFTADGRRLGQGGGHYDRFLPRLRAQCRTVGVGFVEQLVADVPTEAHDVRLDVVVTDAGVAGA